MIRLLAFVLLCACAFHGDTTEGECCDNDFQCGRDQFCEFRECNGDFEERSVGELGERCVAGVECNRGVCETTKNFCYDPECPCRGIACGGVDRGTCVVVDGQPTCACNPGFHNETFALYCCPYPGFGSDPACESG